MNLFKKPAAAYLNAFMNGYPLPPDVPPAKEIYTGEKQTARLIPENARLIPPDRPAPPPPQNVKPRCRHKYEVLEYPEPGRPNFIFYCQYCLDMKEKKPPGAG